MADMQLSGMNFKKLGSHKYHARKFSMKIYLGWKDLWDVDGNLLKPIMTEERDLRNVRI